jgi:diguanylate cyclase (GGDEF)-like protein
LDLELGRVERHGRPLALILMEVDDLAELGEHIGSLSKGYVLSEVGSVLRSTLRINDVGCRYGPEQVAALLPEATETQALAVANKIRSLVAQRAFGGRRPDGGFNLTISQGIALVTRDRVPTRTDLLKSAEQVLAEARANGVDQVKVAQPQRDEPVESQIEQRAS